MKNKESQIPRGFHASLEPQSVEHRPSKHLRADPSKDFMRRGHEGKAAERHPHAQEATTVHFSYETLLPAAAEAILVGDFTKWADEPIRLHHAGGNAWRASLSLKPGRYEYRLIVDGCWTNDPGAKETVPNAFGSANDVLRIQ